MIDVAPFILFAMWIVQRPVELFTFQMEITLYSSENAHTEKHLLWKKARRLKEN